MMIKTAEAGGPALLLGQPALQLVKMSARGLRGEDLKAFLKRASHPAAEALRGLTFAPGEVPVHLIALGATESSGPNRNGDGFKEATCRQYHTTFEKHARLYRDHRNTDPQKSYGLVKRSLYNEPMRRIELIVALNATEEAAQRNGGLVADRELEKLAAGADLPVSMSCRVAFDVCSVCNHAARNRREYCLGEDEGGHCKAGGCRHNLGAVLEDGTQLYVDNPDPVWFDISVVHRPADRIAYTSGVLTA